MTAINGHHSLGALAHKAQPDAPLIGATVEISPKRIGIEGNQILGQIQATARWGAMFAAYAQKTLDIRERQVLTEVSKALLENAEKLKVQLAQIAVQRNAGTITPVDDDEPKGE